MGQKEEPGYPSSAPPLLLIGLHLPKVPYFPWSAVTWTFQTITASEPISDAALCFQLLLLLSNMWL